MQHRVPYGFCHCGCGQKTAIASKPDKRTGARRGEPNKFCIGHSNRVPGFREHMRKIALDRHATMTEAERARWVRSLRGRKQSRVPRAKNDSASRAAAHARYLRTVKSTAECITLYRTEKAARKQSTSYARLMAEAKAELERHMAQLDVVRRGGRPKKRSAA